MLTNTLTAADAQRLAAALSEAAVGPLRAVLAVAEKTLSRLKPDHRDHLRRELGSDEAVDLAVRLGVRSVTADEALAGGFRVWNGEKAQSGSGLLIPFEPSDFAQIRWDSPDRLLDQHGKPAAKYRNKAKTKTGVAIIGESDDGPTIATEGFKDALRLHIETGETIAAIAGVADWRQLPESVRFLVYDADARTNPNVWFPLVLAGLARPSLRVGFFPEDIAGPKGGACEFYNAGGLFEDLRWSTPRELIREIWHGWTKDRTDRKGNLIPGNVRSEWKDISLRRLGKLGYLSGLDRHAVEDIIRGAGKRIGTPADRVKAIAAGLWKQYGGDQAISEGQLTTKQLQDFLRERHAFEFDILSKRFLMDGEPMRPEDAARFDMWLADRYGLDVNHRVAGGVLPYLAMKNPINPVERYLRGVRARTDLKLVSPMEIARAFGIAAEDELSRDMLMRHLVGGLKRWLAPGFKHDQLLLLAGGQGWKKTEAIASLLPDSGWTDSETHVSDFNSWPFLLRIGAAASFVIDEAEHVLRSRSAAELKGMITRRQDSYALKFQNDVVPWRRPAILWGTSNASEFLCDHTGARRFWICPLSHPCDPKWIIGNRDRIWFTIWRLAELGLRNFYDVDSPMAEAAQTRAAAASTEESGVSDVHAYLSALDPRCPGVSQESIIINGLGKEKKEITKAHAAQVTRIVESRGFVTHGGRIRWVKSPKKRRWEPGGALLTGYCPVELEPEGAEEPTEADYSWVCDPIDVFPMFRSVPQGWNTQKPWYDRLLAELFPSSDLFGKSENGTDTQSPHTDPGTIPEDLTAGPPETSVRDVVRLCRSSKEELPKSSELGNTKPESGSGTGLEAVPKSEGDRNTSEQTSEQPTRDGGDRDADFVVGSEWEDPSTKRSLSGRPIFYRVWTVDGSGVTMARHEAASNGNPVLEQGIRLTAELRQRLRPRGCARTTKTAAPVVVTLLPDSAQNEIAVEVFRANPAATGFELWEALRHRGIDVPQATIPRLQRLWLEFGEVVAS